MFKFSIETDDRELAARFVNALTNLGGGPVYSETPGNAPSITRAVNTAAAEDVVREKLSNMTDMPAANVEAPADLPHGDDTEEAREPGKPSTGKKRRTKDQIAADDAYFAAMAKADVQAAEGVAADVPVETPKVDPSPAAQPAPKAQTPSVTIDVVRAATNAIAEKDAGLLMHAVDALSKYGVTKAPELPADKLPLFFADLKKIMEENEVEFAA